MKRKRTDDGSEEHPTKRRKLEESSGESSASEESSEESPEKLDQYKSEVVIKNAKTPEQTIHFAFGKMFPPKKGINPENSTGEKYTIKDETDQIKEKYLPK